VWPSAHEITLSHHIYVIEAKYNLPAHEGLAQIRQRPYGREHLGAGRTVTAVALTFRHDGNRRPGWSVSTPTSPPSCRNGNLQRIQMCMRQCAPRCLSRTSSAAECKVRAQPFPVVRQSESTLWPIQAVRVELLSCDGLF